MFPSSGTGSSGTQKPTKPIKRSSSTALSPPSVNKNRYSPLSNLNEDDNDDNMSLVTQSDGDEAHQSTEVSQKIPPIYVHNIKDFENFHNSLTKMITDELSITQTKYALKINLSSIDDYRHVTKSFDESEIEYHTYQLPSEKPLSIIIRNLPVSISEESVFKALTDLKFSVTSVTRLQNQSKCPIPIVAVLLSISSKEIYSLNRLLHCVVLVEPRKPSKGIPQCTNCQRFSHTKKFCHLPPRCVKCAGDHHFTQCVKEKDTPPKCVNCEKSHPASYRGCTYYKEISKSKNKFNSKQPVNNKNITYQSTQPIVNNEYHNEPLSNDYVNTKRKTYASAAKSNITTDNDFLKTLLPLINSFVSQLMQKIIESLPVIINSINSNLNVQP